MYKKENNLTTCQHLIDNWTTTTVLSAELRHRFDYVSSGKNASCDLVSCDYVSCDSGSGRPWPSALLGMCLVAQGIGQCHYILSSPSSAVLSRKNRGRVRKVFHGNGLKDMCSLKYQMDKLNCHNYYTFSASSSHNFRLSVINY